MKMPNPLLRFSYWSVILLCFIPGDLVNAAPRSKPAEAPSLFKDFAGCLFTVKGDKGSGSGFFCEVQGRTVCMSNAHVFSGSKTLQLATAGGEAITPAADQFHVAANRDLAFFPAKDPRPAVKLCSRMERVNIGDEVVCFGNSDGRFSITDIRGKILGIGPDLVEVNFPIPGGNSGSPLIHVASREASESQLFL
jgi:Trypsin-like peptidase domain